MKDIALHIMDIVQNSISAGATLIVSEVNENAAADRYEVVVTDNGRGMDYQTLERVTDPYFTSRTTRRVGMGIPLLKHNAEQAGGRFDISSEKGIGTRVCAIFSHSSLDRPPAGDIPGVISLLAGTNSSLDFVYRHTTENGEYTFDTREIKEALENVPITEPAVIRYIKEMIGENIETLRKGEQ